MLINSPVLDKKVFGLDTANESVEHCCSST